MANAADLISALEAIADPEEVPKVTRFFNGETDVLGVSIGKVFPIARAHMTMTLGAVEALLEDSRYEVRMAAVAILDFKARQKKLPDDERKALFDLYLRRHDRIDNWDLVDRAAPHVVGEYLVDRERSVLDRLARSPDANERRTALVATHAFIKRGETGDTFRIADILAADPDAYVQKAVASWVREAGKRDEAALVRFLRKNRNRLPRTTITAASKLLAEDIRQSLR